MIANIIYLTTLLVFIFICIAPLFQLKTSRESIIAEYKEEISNCLNQKIIKLDIGFDSYTGETKQWQEEFNQKILEINNSFRKASSAALKSSTFDRIEKQMRDVKQSMHELIYSEKYLHNCKNDVVKYLTELRVSLVEEPNNEILKHHFEVLSELVETDPLGSFNAMNTLQRKNNQKKKKNNG